MQPPGPLEVQIFVRDGEILAEKTLNRRLGVLGGISILGTTGIVRPISAKAWTDTIDASMQVARAAGLDEVILATGRTSEAAVQSYLGLAEESQVMMGDYLKYALEAAGRHGFQKIIWPKCGQNWSKLPWVSRRHMSVMAHSRPIMRLIYSNLWDWTQKQAKNSTRPILPVKSMIIYAQ